MPGLIVNESKIFTLPYQGGKNQTADLDINFDVKIFETTSSGYHRQEGKDTKETFMVQNTGACAH